jgi:putative flippase GtrA
MRHPVNWGVTWLSVSGHGFWLRSLCSLDGMAGSICVCRYLAASLRSSLINITVSYLGYKWFVFKTRGHYWREWRRCVLVYSGGIALGLILLPPTVWLVTHVTGNPRMAPYLAGALLLGFQVILSFIGHKTFSFRR